MKYEYFESCAGCGGLSYGLELAGLHADTLIEIDKTCCKTLENNFKNTKIICDDMRKIDYTKWKNKIDVVISGIPCQSWSLSGERKGFGDANKGGLFFDFIRCLKEIEPKIFLIENVEGLVSHNKGKSLEYMIEELEKLGYDVQYKILNAVKYLVPQKRKRIIIIGTTHDIKFEYPEEHDQIITLEKALKDVPFSAGIEYSEKVKNIMLKIPEGGNWKNLTLEQQKEYMKKSFYSGGGKT